MSTPIFLHRAVIERLHEMQIERFGGAYGLRDAGILELASLVRSTEPLMAVMI